LKQASLELIGFNESRTAIKRGELDEAAKIASSQLSQDRLAVINFQLALAWFERSDFEPLTLLCIVAGLIRFSGLTSRHRRF
jgi:hypothetical protein